VMLMDLVLSLVDWNNLVDLFNVWDNLVLRLVVNVDNWLVNFGHMQVVLVEVVLVDSVFVQVVLKKRSDNCIVMNMKLKCFGAF